MGTEREQQSVEAVAAAGARRRAPGSEFLGARIGNRAFARLVGRQSRPPGTQPGGRTP
jgi:hypothetical protein